MFKQQSKHSFILSVILSAVLFIPAIAEAHCDSMDGPVVTDAKEALKTGNVDMVLIWVTEAQEKEVRESFRKTMNVRDVNEEVREMADMYFFETLVRLHRKAEGAPYTGLKPAGTKVSPAIRAAEEALDKGSLSEVRDLLLQNIEEGLHHYFEKVNSLKNYSSGDIDTGRAYVDAYVKYIHYVEPLYQIATGEVAHGVGQQEL